MCTGSGRVMQRAGGITLSRRLSRGPGGACLAGAHGIEIVFRGAPLFRRRRKAPRACGMRVRGTTCAAAAATRQSEPRDPHAAAANNPTPLSA